MKNDKEKRLRALANGHRLRILALLKEPVKNFPPQVDGDLVKDGVCAIFIEEKLKSGAADHRPAPQGARQFRLS